MANLEEKRVSRTEIYKGKVLDVVCDTVMLPNGEEATREVCLHVGAVSIIPILPDGRVIMERQYRYAHGRLFYEIPAGKLNSADEDPLLAAKRELREETGAIAGKMTFIGELDTSPAILSEKIYMYIAEDLTFGERMLDDDEFLEIETAHIDDLYRMVMAGQISDAKTQISVMKAYELLRRNK